MKIVALDTWVSDFDGLEWAGFSELGEFQKYNRSTPEEAKARVSEADVIITNKVEINKALLESAPKAKLILETATGVNNIDLELCAELGIRVANVPGYSSASVAELVFAFIHDKASEVSRQYDASHVASYAEGVYFSKLACPTSEISGKTLGILGYGDIGKKVEHIAKAYGMSVVIGKLPGRSYPTDSKRLELGSFLPKCDYLSIHCPLTSVTEGLVDLEFLSKMKSSAVLINTSRGPVVNEEDLDSALKRGVISRAYLDVLAAEPPSSDLPLLKNPNVRITPHIAWATREARERLLNETKLNLEAFLEEKSRNLVS